MAVVDIRWYGRSLKKGRSWWARGDVQLELPGVAVQVALWEGAVWSNRGSEGWYVFELRRGACRDEEGRMSAVVMMRRWGMTYGRAVALIEVAGRSLCPGLQLALTA